MTQLHGARFLISLSQPNPQFNNFTAPAKFSIHWFHCPSQIVTEFSHLSVGACGWLHCHMFEHVPWLSYMVQEFQFHCPSQILNSLISLSQPNELYPLDFCQLLTLTNWHICGTVGKLSSRAIQWRRSHPNALSRSKCAGIIPNRFSEMLFSLYHLNQSFKLFLPTNNLLVLVNSYPTIYILFWLSNIS